MRTAAREGRSLITGVEARNAQCSPARQKPRLTEQRGIPSIGEGAAGERAWTFKEEARRRRATDLMDKVIARVSRTSSGAISIVVFVS